MASSKQVLLLAAVVAVACLASLASATQWVVGDEAGWRAKFNQVGWADGKTFRVCTKTNHCLNGMKLVVDDNSAPPAPSPFPGVPAPQPSPVCPFPFPFCGPASPAPAP